MQKSKRDEWYNLLHLLNIMNDTTFSCSHFSNSHSFLSAGKQSEHSSPGSQTAKAKACCLVSGESVSVDQTGAWSPWAEGGVVRREGDEIRLVAVLDQVFFRCVRIALFGTWFGTEEALVLTLRNFSPFSFQSKTERRAVLEVTDCLDHVPNVS